MPSTAVFGAAVAVVLVATASFVAMGGRGVHDMIAGTKVVAVTPFHLSSVQLGVKGRDPVVTQRMMVGVGALVALILVNAAAHFMGIDFWIY